MHQVSDILDHVPAALLVVFRISGLMIFGPIFGSRVIPPQIKVYLCVVLGLAIYPLVGFEHVEAVRWELGLWTLVPIAAGELVIGLVIGFLASLPLIAIQIGGLLMGQQMGLGFARFFNPTIEDDADVLGQVLFFMVLAGFLLVGGHESMVLAVMHSFEHVPPPAVTTLGSGADLLGLVVGVMTASTELALRVAAPLLAIIFLQTLAMGFLAKTVPQLNILSLGFPMRVLLGLLMVILGLVVMDEVVMELLDRTVEAIFAWIEGH